MTGSLVQFSDAGVRRDVVVLTADFAPLAPAVEHTDADAAGAAPLCCAACGHAQPLEVSLASRLCNRIVELTCAHCGSITLALCPQDLGVAFESVRRVRGFFCQTLLCSQQFLLAPRAADALLSGLAPGQFSQRCPRCGVEFVVGVPHDLWSAFQTTLQRWHSVADLTPVGATPISARSELAPGACLGAYVVDHLIAEGGAAMVYAARGPGQDRVALKVLHGELVSSARIRRRFRREGDALLRIHHPNVVRLIERGEDSGLAYLVLERLEGCSLRERLWKEQVLSTDEALRMFGQVCDALGAVHAAGFVHCDVKPENIVLSPDHGIKLVDLGIAEPLGAPRSIDRPSDGVGSPSYMAPEQLHGGRIGPHTDVYALGLTLYEAMTDDWPWPEMRPITRCERVKRCRGPARRSSLLERQIPAVSRLLLECLATDPVARPSLPEVRERLALAHQRWCALHLGDPGLFRRLCGLLGS